MKITLLNCTDNPEQSIFNAARVCYDSAPKDPEGISRFVLGLVKSGHTAMVEHANATVLIEDCSRVMTHELVRHRLFSFAQRSQRYVDESEPSYVVLDPEKSSISTLDEDKRKEAERIFEEAMSNAWGSYSQLLALGLKKEDARFVLPNACTTTIVVSGNFREWRNFFTLRLSPRAQWEIRDAAYQILDMLWAKAPSVFQDFKDGTSIQLT